MSDDQNPDGPVFATARALHSERGGGEPESGQSRSQKEETSAMAYRSISAANLSQIPVGTRVKFNYGAMHGSELGTVTGSRVGRFGASLTAITDDGEAKDIHGFGNVGVGVYLIDERLSAEFLGE